MSPIVDPALTDPETVLGALDFAGVAVFAATGALAAAQQRHDLVTFAFFGAITGVGGGTLRDLLIVAPVFWVQDWRFAATCLVTAALVWVTPKSFWNARAHCITQWAQIVHQLLPFETVTCHPCRSSGLNSLKLAFYRRA